MSGDRSQILWTLIETKKVSGSESQRPALLRQTIVNNCQKAILDQIFLDIDYVKR